MRYESIPSAIECESSSTSAKHAILFWEFQESNIYAWLPRECWVFFCLLFHQLESWHFIWCLRSPLPFFWGGNCQRTFSERFDTVKNFYEIKERISWKYEPQMWSNEEEEEQEEKGKPTLIKQWENLFYVNYESFWHLLQHSYLAYDVNASHTILCCV